MTRFYSFFLIKAIRESIVLKKKINNGIEVSKLCRLCHKFISKIQTLSLNNNRVVKSNKIEFLIVIPRRTRQDEFVYDNAK